MSKCLYYYKDKWFNIIDNSFVNYKKLTLARLSLL